MGKRMMRSRQMSKLAYAKQVRVLELTQVVSIAFCSYAFFKTAADPCLYTNAGLQLQQQAPA